MTISFYTDDVTTVQTSTHDATTVHTSTNDATTVQTSTNDVTTVQTSTNDVTTVQTSTNEPEPTTEQTGTTQHFTTDNFISYSTVDQTIPLTSESTSIAQTNPKKEFTYSKAGKGIDMEREASIE